MSIESQMEREEQSLLDDYSEGRLTLAEYNKAVNALHREYREAARESAQNAYDREMDCW